MPRSSRSGRRCASCSPTADLARVILAHRLSPTLPLSRAYRSRRPYLIRAIYDWAVDNGYTPHVLVAADYPGVAVPLQHVQDGRITLNLSPMAVQSLHVGEDPIWFSARFSGRAFEVVIPCGAVLAIFARENGAGGVFGEVGGKCTLVTDRLFFPVGHHRPFIISRRAFAPAGPIVAEQRPQALFVGAAQFAECEQPCRSDFFALLAPESRQALHRQRIEHRMHSICSNDRQAVGLIEIRSNLGHELVTGNADRCGQRCFARDALLDVAGDAHRIAF